MINNKKIFEICTMIPFGVSVIAVYIQSVWLTVAAIVLVFILVSILPICHGYENMWVFIMIAYIAIPINLFILIEYGSWINFVFVGSNGGFTYFMSLIQYILILSSIEQILAGLIARIIWKRQYKLYIPV